MLFICGVNGTGLNPPTLAISHHARIIIHPFAARKEIAQPYVHSLAGRRVENLLHTHMRLCPSNPLPVLSDSHSTAHSRLNKRSGGSWCSCSRAPVFLLHFLSWINNVASSVPLIIVQDSFSSVSPPPHAFVSVSQRRKAVCSFRARLLGYWRTPSHSFIHWPVSVTHSAISFWIWWQLQDNCLWMFISWDFNREEIPFNHQESVYYRDCKYLRINTNPIMIILYHGIWRIMQRF